MRFYNFRVVYWLGSCITEKIIEAFTEQNARDKMKDFDIVNVEKMN